MQRYCGLEKQNRDLGGSGGDMRWEIGAFEEDSVWIVGKEKTQKMMLFRRDFVYLQ